MQRYRPGEVGDPQRIMRIMALDEPFIISDLPAPGSKAAGSAASSKPANKRWQPSGPDVLSAKNLKEALGPRRLVAPLCTLANGTSFSNFRPGGGEREDREQEPFLSSTCEMAWEHVVDGVFAEKPLPVAARLLDGAGAGGAGSTEGPEGEAIVRRPVKLQMRLVFSDVMQMVERILQGVPAHIWGGWDFVNMDKSVVFMGSRESRTPLHKDDFNSLVMHLNGTKHWTLLLDGTETKELIWGLIDPRDDVRQRRGPLRLEEPLRSGLRVRSCTLRPFEVLYVPRSTWHDVYSLTSGASLSVRLNPIFDEIVKRNRPLATA